MRSQNSDVSRYFALSRGRCARKCRKTPPSQGTGAAQSQGGIDPVALHYLLDLGLGLQ
jgi:hypothetical protein